MRANTGRKKGRKVRLRATPWMIRAACQYETFCQDLMSTADSEGLRRNRSMISDLRTVCHVFLFMDRSCYYY